MGGTSTPRSTPTIPFLPGHVHHVTKMRHNRAQTLVYKLDCVADNLRPSTPRLDNLTPRPTTPRAATPTQRPATPRATAADCITPRATTPRPATPSLRERKESARNTYRPAVQPAWLRHDRQVLRFFTYYLEPVSESKSENFRVRNCTLCFYLEDGTMQVTEPKVQNSGIWPQGPFVKRHRVPKDGGFVTPEDLRLGTAVTIYSRTFRIVDCDDFTRWFYGEAGYEIGEPEDAPLDSFFQNEVHKKESLLIKTGLPSDVMESKEYTELKLGGSRKNRRLRQFMENDRKVLRFYAYWDDHTRYGARQYFTVHYYLADDTVEILNACARNSGRDPYPVFFTRGPMQKTPSLTAPGMRADGAQVEPQDFVLGATLPVYGRQFFLYDCDAATMQFYKEYLGVELKPVAVPDEPSTHVKLSVPPHTGFGSEDDSLVSCMRLVPPSGLCPPPRKDLANLMATSNKVLRFEARPVNGMAEDAQRMFLVSFFVGDSTVACFEIKQRNSGQVEGKFRERGVLTNKRTQAPYCAGDFFVGQTVIISAMPMLLTRADEYTLKYMEKDARWPMSSPSAIAQKLHGLECPGVPTLAPEDLRALVEKQLGFTLVDQELVTLLRFCCDPDTVAIKVDKLKGLI